MTPEEKAALESIVGVVSRETVVALESFIAQFRLWSARINLAAPTTIPDLFHRHVLDSAQLPRLAPDANRWLDLGSGGGFPGAIVAILMRDKQNSKVELVESNRKKAAFLAAALARAGAPARVHAVRIEEAGRLVPSADIVTARALAPLDKLLELADPWLRSGAIGLFHKGRDWRREIEESGRAARYDLLSHPSAIDAEGVILRVTHRRNNVAANPGCGDELQKPART
ncbi:MAG: 16S rRNA (guanine(527)-N(7))-methyltransferase RsmG [Phyllobacteriaceae bacterium]|nr:16S rRNA (guanine(527)-N(7))-methyltransferase RsmG [Phyllobacteriaceae bacterium]